MRICMYIYRDAVSFSRSFAACFFSSLDSLTISLCCSLAHSLLLLRTSSAIYIHIDIYKYVHIYEYDILCIYNLCIYLYDYIHMYIYIYIYIMYTYVYTYLYIGTYWDTCTHTYPNI